MPKNNASFEAGEEPVSKLALVQENGFFYLTESLAEPQR